MKAARRQAGELRSSARPTEVQRLSSQTGTGVRQPCFRCGKTVHSNDKCYYWSQKCRACGKRGHIAKMCKQVREQVKPVKSRNQTRDHRTRFVESQVQTTKSECDGALFAVRSDHEWADSGIMVSPEVNGTQIAMKRDTGASVSIISEKLWKAKLPTAPLEPFDTVLRTYTGESLQVPGQVWVHVKLNDQEAELPLLVVKGKGPSHFGRNWLKRIRLNWGQIKMTDELTILLLEYDDLFKEGLGTVSDIRAKLSVREGSKPKFFKPRPVPCALKKAIEKDLERLEGLGVIEPVRHSEWAAPIVPVPKSDGSIRICGDYKVTINLILEIDQYPLPRPEDLLTLSGGQKFTKMDLSHAYHQLLLEESSTDLVTVNTHRGLYKYKRLPFGVASAPAIFQQLMERVLQGLPGVVCYMDDVLVTGKNDGEYLENLEPVFESLHQHGMRLKTKCYFMQQSVEYLGYRIGLHATQDKSKPLPMLHSLRMFVNYVPSSPGSFIDLINYGKFVKSMASIAQPLYRLLQRNVKWEWTKECEVAFRKLKEQLMSTTVLVHYDATLPLKLACDASSYGVGALIAHIMTHGSERPIAYASHTFNWSEKNYSQIEKEALAIFGIKKFHQFLYSRHFTLVTDRKPLTTILGPKTSIPTLAAAHLQRWAILLAAYQYDVEFRETAKHGNADGLSRLPLPTEDTMCGSEASLFNVLQVNTLPVKAEQLRKATSEDPVLSKLMQYTLNGWPSQPTAELVPYYLKRLELSISRLR